MLLEEIFYKGVVEDRNDPLQLGRVRVRVLGVHSEDPSLIPTKDLPWAPVHASAQNPAISGLGWSANGLVPGSWVRVYFADGDSKQIPIVDASLPGINPQNKPIPTSNTTKTTTVSTGNNANNSSNGNFGTSDMAQAVAQSESHVANKEWTPGYITENREAGVNGGAWTIAKDTVGYSYGSIQISQTEVSKFLNVSSFKTSFTGLSPGTAQFNYTWDKIGKDNADSFSKEQKEYSLKSNYTPMMNSLKNYRLDARSRGVQECLYSTANQYGPSKAANLIRQALYNQDVANLKDSDIVNLIYSKKESTTGTYFASALAKGTASVSGLNNGWNNEKKLILLDIGENSSSNIKPKELETNVYGDEEVPQDPLPVPIKENKPLTITFADPSGKYPKNNYLGQPDTNFLATARKLEKTILDFKKKTKIKGNGYEEPDSPYVAKYPFNKVYESEAGHIIEIDDTPLGERIHVYHKSGSYIEFQPDGTIVKKSYKDDHQIVLGEDKTYVTGNMSIFVEGNVSLKTLGNIDIQAEDNINLLAGGNVNFSCGGSMTLNSNNIMEIASANKIIHSAPRIEQNQDGGGGVVAAQIGEKIKVVRELARQDDPPFVDDNGGELGETFFNTAEELDKFNGYTEPNDGSAAVKPKETTSTNVATSDSNNYPIGELTTDLQLSEHFTLGDLTTGVALQSSRYKVAAQAGLTEEQIVENLRSLANNVLEPLVTKFGRSSFIITSAFRLVNGDRASHHHLGFAVDVQFPGLDAVHQAQEIRLILPKYDQIILEYHARNPVIHISFSDKLRKMILTTFSTNFSGLKPHGFYDKNKNLVYSA